MTPRFASISTVSTVSTISSISVGHPESRGIEGAAEWFQQPWTTAIYKRKATGPVRVGVLGLSGDGQADATHHGGPDKAICVYSGDHYAAWRATLGLGDFVDGAFGENVTVRAQAEGDVCIGDTWSVGTVLVQISQPRQPCWKLAQKWRIKDLTAQTVANGWTGWYVRVLREGIIATGDALTLVERPHPAWTVAAANAVMHKGAGDAAALAALLQLSSSWRQTLAARLGRERP